MAAFFAVSSVGHTMSNCTPFDLQRLLIHEELRQLVARYAVGIATRDFESVVGLFVDDVRVAPGVVGRQHLKAWLEAGARDLPVTMLITGTHQIEVDGENLARGVLFCRAEIGDAANWAHQLIVYEDVYERRNGRWYFRVRKHLLVYGQNQDLRPLAQPPANWPESQVGAGTAPMHWESWQQFHC
ncbi:MAG: nuclear transport factor 2 family protein [Spongiibacteraceae bacterium]